MGGWQAVRACAIVLAFASVAPVSVRAEIGSTPAPSAGGSSESVKHYDVRGRTLEEVRAEIFLSGPSDETDGQRFAGWTAWSIHWQYDLRTGRDGCRIQNVTTDTQITYTLPRWVDEAQASPDVQQAWRRFDTALVEHEKGHGQLARELARRIEKAMAALPPQASCDGLEVEARALGTRMIVTDDRQAAYDRRTMHGEKQGAIFPRVLVRRAGAAPSAIR